MSNFYARDGQFWLDDKALLIHAAEFHYFRTPREQWRQRLGLLQEAGFNTLATYIPWLWHETEEGAIDVDGHSHPMRDLAGFLDLGAEMGFLLIPRPGPYIMAETINEGVPPWLFASYPQVAFVDQNEQSQNIVSYLHPDFLACVERWFEGVFAVLTPRQVSRGGRIVMIQLDNEMGMPHWVRNIFDVNPDTVVRFAAWVESTYGSRLADRYGAASGAGGLPAVLRELLVRPSAPDAARVVDDYRRFYREYLHDYADFLWRAARARGMEMPPVVNVHGFTNDRGGRTFPIGLSQLIRVIEMPGMISATDVYPMHIDEGNFDQLLFVNEATKAVQNKDQALFSIEFQSGGNQDFSGLQSSFFDLHSRLCISVGMRAINHYLFTAGENDPILSPTRRHDWGPPIRNDGTVRNHFPRYGRLSRVLNAYGEALTLSQPHTVTTVGYLLDHFMTEVNNAFTREATAVVAHQRERILHDFIVRGLALSHRPFDAVELARAELDPAATPTLWVMLDKQCPAGVQEKLLAYARRGGGLIIAGRLPEEEPDGTPAPILRNALGVTGVESDPPFADSAIRAFDYPYIPVSFVESYTGDFDEVFSTRGSGETVGFVKALERGRIMVFGAALTANTLDDLDVLHRMALMMGCAPLFELNEWADVRVSRGDRGSFLFISNYLDDPVAPAITCDGEPLFGGNPVPLPARRGLILPLEWRVTDDVTLHYSTAEVVEVTTGDGGIMLRLIPDEYTAELTLDGYHCDSAAVVRESGAATRTRVRGTDGKIALRKDS